MRNVPVEENPISLEAVDLELAKSRAYIIGTTDKTTVANIMEQKFKAGGRVRILATGEQAKVIKYQVNNAVGILRAISRKNIFPGQPDSFIMSKVLCEKIVSGKRKRSYVLEDGLELIELAS